MAKGAGQKIKILYLMKIMYEQTDDVHGLTVAQIAQVMGFGDAGYFIKCFKKLEHITPLEFLKTRI